VIPMPLASTSALWHKAGMPEDTKEIRTHLLRLLREAATLTRGLTRSETAREVPGSAGPSRLHVERYGGTRFFALYDGEELLAVTVYRKGAETVRDRLQALEARLAAPAHDQEPDGPEQGSAVERLQAERDAEKTCTQGRRGPVSKTWGSATGR
jgi:hypothetical protein